METLTTTIPKTYKVSIYRRIVFSIFEKFQLGQLTLILPEGETEETTTHDTSGAYKISFEKVFEKPIELFN